MVMVPRQVPAGPASCGLNPGKAGSVPESASAAARSPRCQPPRQHRAGDATPSQPCEIFVTNTRQSGDNWRAAASYCRRGGPNRGTLCKRLQELADNHRSVNIPTTRPSPLGPATAAAAVAAGGQTTVRSAANARKGRPPCPHLKAANAATACGDFDLALAEAQVAYGAGSASLDDALMAKSALLMQMLMTNLGRTEESLAWADRAQRHCTAAGRLELEAQSHAVRAPNLAASDPGAAMKAITRALDLLRNTAASAQVRQVVMTGACLTYQQLGMPPQALATAREALAAAKDLGVPLREQRARVNLVDAGLAMFDIITVTAPAEARALLDDLLVVADDLAAFARLDPGPYAIAAYRHAAGRVLLRAGRCTEARDHIEKLVANPGRVSSALTVELHIDAALAAQACGDAEATQRHAQRAHDLLPSIAASGETPDLSRLAQLEALLGRHEQAMMQSRLLKALDGRVEQLTARLAEQALRLEVADLRQRNAGLARSVDEISHAADHDPLTGVPNRRALEAAYQRLQQAGPLALVMIDVDHFKDVNDRHSHVVGDVVLQQVAGIMAIDLRTDDILGRYGGEEFVALLSIATLDAAVKVADRMRALVEQFDWGTVRDGLAVTVSMGVATLAPGENFVSLVARADAALYRAKRDGRNRVVRASPPAHDT